MPIPALHLGEMGLTGFKTDSVREARENADSDSVGLGMCPVLDQLQEMFMLLVTRPHLE